jgi:hypothetical protein
VSLSALGVWHCKAHMPACSQQPAEPVCPQAHHTLSVEDSCCLTDSGQACRLLLRQPLPAVCCPVAVAGIAVTAHWLLVTTAAATATCGVFTPAAAALVLLLLMPVR